MRYIIHLIVNLIIFILTVKGGQIIIGDLQISTHWNILVAILAWYHCLDSMDNYTKSRRLNDDV